MKGIIGAPVISVNMKLIINFDKEMFSGSKKNQFGLLNRYTNDTLNM